MLRSTFAVLIFLCALVHAADEAPVPIGGHKQVFIDGRFIAKSENIELRANQAQKLGLIQDEQGNRIFDHPSRVIEVGGKIRLYAGANSLVLYESEDGLRFTRSGTSIQGGIFTTIFLDEHDPDPARRYKLFWINFTPPFDPAVHGVYAGYSSDGINFTEVGRVLPFYTDNPNIVYWDERIGKYIIFTRALALDSENQRRIARIETDDPLRLWPYTKMEKDGMFFTPGNAQVVLAADAEDNPHSDIYYNAATLYPWAQDVYLMFTAQFRHFSPDRNPYIRPRTPGAWEDYGLLEIQLAVSRDGIAWQRPSREPYFPTGLADEWDRWYAVMAPGMAKRGNYLYQYYVSSGRTHDSVILRPEYDAVPAELGGIGAVRQRLDGFVSADADHHGGWLETPLLTFEGKCLRLNIDTGAMGTAFVEIRDAASKPLAGFTLEQCEEIGGNFIDQAVYWSGSRDVSALQGKPVRLYFRLTRAKLYAFQFTQE
ncbi:MAG: hypothetical protein IT365_04030 [Candidatus Hydrogenedentes bacterium]|nr:hypothetical protein [Candidatus Hydrogenedentota bacterium]